METFLLVLLVLALLALGVFLGWCALRAWSGDNLFDWLFAWWMADAAIDCLGAALKIAAELVAGWLSGSDS